MTTITQYNMCVIQMINENNMKKKKMKNKTNKNNYKLK